MGVVIFDGVRSDDLGILVEHGPVYSIPERDYETIHVPGRNGDVYIDRGCYKNVSQPYDIAVASLEQSFFDLSTKLSFWLHPKPGYCRLEDSYSPQYFRLASYHDSIDLENILFHAGRATISFDCKPQRFLKSGERKVIFTSSGKLRNPAFETSSPLITVRGNANGSGRLQIGTYVVEISPIRSSITLDSELQDAYSGVTNRNADITLGPGGFPKLIPGENAISFSGDISSVEVIPRWWIV